MSRARIACVVSLFVAMLAACASVADLDVKYQPEVNAGDGGVDGAADAGPGPAIRTVRDSSAVIVVIPPPEDASTVLPTTCASGNLDQGGTEIGCDTAAGRGCCIRPNADNQCMEQKDLDKCGRGNFFVGCLRASGDTACCWRVKDGLTVALPCSDGGVPACLEDSDCPGAAPDSCKKTLCKGGVTIGQCGTEAPKCAQ